MVYNWLYNTSNDNIYILILIIVILALIIVNFKMWSKKTDRFFDVPGAMWINKGTGDNMTPIVNQEIYNASLGAANGEGDYTKTNTGQITINGISYTYASPPPFSGPGIGGTTNYNTILDVTTLNSAGQSPTNPNYTYIYVTLTNPPTTTSGSATTTTSGSTTTTKKPSMWISLGTGNPVTVTQQIYDKSIVEGLDNNYNKINSGTVMINGNTYNFVTPSPFTYGNYNYNIIKDIAAFSLDQNSNIDD